MLSELETVDLVESLSHVRQDTELVCCWWKSRDQPDDE